MKFRNTLLNAFTQDVLCPQEGKSVLGFKEIRHTPFFMTDTQFKGYMNLLLNTFPDARIVFSTRNADDVAKSAWHARQEVDRIKRWVGICDERFARFDASSDRTILMRYADHVADHSSIAKLFSFLGHDYDAGTVEAIFSKPLRHAK